MPELTGSEPLLQKKSFYLTPDPCSELPNSCCDHMYSDWDLLLTSIKSKDMKGSKENEYFPITELIKYKVACLCFDAINNSGPGGRVHALCRWWREMAVIPVPMMKRDGSDWPKIFHHTNRLLITSMVMWHQRQVFGGLKLRKNNNNLKQGWLLAFHDIPCIWHTTTG